MDVRCHVSTFRRLENALSAVDVVGGTTRSKQRSVSIFLNNFRVSCETDQYRNLVREIFHHTYPIKYRNISNYEIQIPISNMIAGKIIKSDQTNT